VTRSDARDGLEAAVMRRDFQLLERVDVERFVEAPG
jgi:hypothetical protein